MPINISRGGTVVLSISEDYADRLLRELTALSPGEVRAGGAIEALVNILTDVSPDPMRSERPEPTRTTETTER